VKKFPIDEPFARRLRRAFDATTGRLFGIELQLNRYRPDRDFAEVVAGDAFAHTDRAQLIAMKFGVYDPARAEFHLLHDTGLFSCLSAALWSLCDLLGAGFVPRKLNFGGTLSAYRDEQTRDLHPLLFDTPDVRALEEALPHLSRERFRRFDHHGSYAQLDFALLSLLIGTYLHAGPGITEHVATFTAKYISPAHRHVGVCIRGTDKEMEVPSTDSAIYIEYVDRLLQGGQADRVLIQTDQAQICDLFKRYFGEACVVIEEIPRTSGKTVVHKTDQIAGQRQAFAINMIAAVRVLSAMPVVVTHTGNVGAWITLMRGSSVGVHQAFREGIVALGGAQVDDGGGGAR
jgi:hypothetical protein